MKPGKAMALMTAGLILLPTAGWAQVSGAKSGWRYSGADANRSIGSGGATNPRVSGAQFPLPAPAPPPPKMPPDYSKPQPVKPPPSVGTSTGNIAAFTYRAPNDWTPPSGYGYRHFAMGDILPLPFFARSYWIDHYTRYNLGTAFAGTVWVRVGPDALLVNKVSRKVLDAQYDLFR